MRLISVILFVLLFSCSPKGSNEIKEECKESYVPEEGYVPNEATAIKIAEAVWFPIYDSSIFEEKPFKAILKDGIWHVEGTLAEGKLGGVAYADIRKSNGEVIRAIHTK